MLCYHAGPWKTPEMEPIKKILATTPVNWCTITLTSEGKGKQTSMRNLSVFKQSSHQSRAKSKQEIVNNDMHLEFKRAQIIIYE
jgi:hypothetical protein